MESKYLDFELDAEDVRLYAQFTQYMQTTLIRAKRDYLEKELNYRGMLSNEIVSLEEQYDLADPKAVEEIERLLNWEMIKSHLNVLTLREAEVISCLFINKMTQEECARELSISRPRVTMLYRKALLRLKKSMEAEDGSF